MHGGQQRGFGHLVDRSAGGAAAKQYGGRSLDHFDGLQVETVAGIDGSVANPVEEEIVEGGESAQIDRIATRGAFTGIEGDAGDILQRIFEAGRGLRLHQLVADDGQ